MRFSDTKPAVLLLSMMAQLFQAIYVTIAEFGAHNPPPGQLDDNIFFEKRTRALLDESWLSERRGVRVGRRFRLPRLKDSVIDVIKVCPT